MSGRKFNSWADDKLPTDAKSVSATVSEWDAMTAEWARNWCEGANGVHWRKGHVSDGNGGPICIRCGDMINGSEVRP